MHLLTCAAHTGNIQLQQDAQVRYNEDSLVSCLSVLRVDRPLPGGHGDRLRC